MARQVINLDASDLRSFAEAVEPSLRWKYDPVTAARVPDADRSDAVEEWVCRVQEEWGACGRVVVVDEAPVAYVLYAPPVHLPGLGDVATGPPSADAVVLAELYVSPEVRGAGVGKLLVHAVAKDLTLRDVAALETFATHAPSPDRGITTHSRTTASHRGTGTSDASLIGDPERAAPGRPGELLPVGFLEAVGFATHRTHSTTPRMRMDLRAARTWMDEVELALERLMGAVRPVIKPGFKPAPKPQTRSLRSGPRAP